MPALLLNDTLVKNVVILNADKEDNRKELLDFSEANELICTVSGRAYYKTNDGLAIGGYHYRGSVASDYFNTKDYTNPLLISEIANATNYHASSSFVETKTNSFVYDKDGKTYYCSTGDIAMSGNQTNSNGRGVKLDGIPEIITAVENGRDFIFAVLDYYYGYI